VAEPPFREIVAGGGVVGEVRVWWCGGLIDENTRRGAVRCGAKV